MPSHSAATGHDFTAVVRSALDGAERTRELNSFTPKRVAPSTSRSLVTTSTTSGIRHTIYSAHRERWEAVYCAPGLRDRARELARGSNIVST